MNYSEMPWRQLTMRLYDERVQQRRQPAAALETETARLWTEAARRVKLIARKGFRKQIPICDLEDVEQRVLLKLLVEDNLRAAAGSNSPGIYIAHMIRNEALDFLRRKVREEVASLQIETETAAVPAADEITEENELYARLDAEFAMLPPSDRLLLAKKFWDGMDIGDIASQMNLPYSTVAKRLLRAVAKLRERLEVSGT